MKIAFIANTESGYLEQQSLLLFHSIRKYCGAFSDAEIHSFQPRRGPSLKNKTLNLFSSLNITHHTQILNKQFSCFPRTNKIFACAWAENHLTADILVFVDSDTLFLQEPQEFYLKDDEKVAMRPVDSKGIGCQKKKYHVNSIYWKKLYALHKVDPPPFIKTTVDRKKIRAYWNSGLIVVKRKHGLFNTWLDDFLRTMSAQIYPPVAYKPNIGYPFLDQSTWAITLSRIFEEVRILPPSYNYCLPKRPIMPWKQRSVPLKDLIHIHYHKVFENFENLLFVKPKFNSHCEKYQWISNYLRKQNGF